MCEKEIYFELDNISGIVRHGNAYYHSACFVDYCKGRAAESGSPLWQKYIDDMTPFENAAKEKINYKKTKDEFDHYLLEHYDIQKTESYFWMTVAQLEKGKYAQRKCKPVPLSTLFCAWKWGQKNLDSINRNNKKNRKGPKTDVERLNYDLSIIVKHIPDYLKAKAKLDAEEAERVAREKERVKINYSNFNIVPVKAEGLDDISALLDEF
jgi:hypothetical protein